MSLRLDVYLAENSLAPSRSRAKALIKNGYVKIDGRVETKPSFPVDDGSVVTVEGDVCPYVSRGGLKLEHALDAFGINPTGARALDIGASTGGFTDCLLQRGASSVCAVDSGEGQLAASLRADPRVRCIERFNARYMTPDSPGGYFDLVVADVSFISQTLIIPAAASVMADSAVYIGLIKPQFEAGRPNIGKNGIVRSEAARADSIRRVLVAASGAGLTPFALDVSPIKGGDGNVEYLFACSRGKRQPVGDEMIEKVVYGR